MAVVETWIHLFLISALNGDEWLASHAGRSTCGEGIPLTIQQEAGRAPEPGWTFWRRVKCLSLAGIRHPDSQPVA
jgi:hypothetical protein